MARRLTALLCLALTALLLLCLPSGFLWLREQGESRVDESLVPKKSELITLWLLSDDTGGLKTLKSLIAAFEKENRAYRVLLKKADKSELLQNAVLPDAILFGLGDIQSPDTLLKPLTALAGCREDAALCGVNSGIRYALPLWFEPSVLAVDHALLTPDAAVPTQTPKPLLPLLPAQTPNVTEAPKEDESALWRRLIESRALRLPEGVAALQLKCSCPKELRAALAGGVSADGSARCLPYREAVKQSGAKLVPLLPATADRVLLIGLCDRSEKTEKLLHYLLSDAAQDTLYQEGLFSTREGATLPEAVYEQSLVLPNAFRQSREALARYCADAFALDGDPVPHVLTLR